MKFILIGGSGFVGSAILNEAIDRKHELKVLVRNPEKITVKNENVTVECCDVKNEDKLIESIKGYDIVISAYNPGWTNPDIYIENKTVYPKIVEACKKAKVQRLIMVGGAGSLSDSDGVKLMDKGVFPEAIMPGVKGLSEFYYNVLCVEKTIDWVFICPPQVLSPGKRTGEYRMGKDTAVVGKDGVSSISVEDFAKAMIDELENTSHHKERMTVGY